MASRILLAEDEENIASFIERGLKESGYEVTVVPDGLAGWKQVQKEKFDLLILDIIMPCMDGIQLCHAFRNEFGFSVPILMVTALGTTEDIVAGLDAGADDYISKPFNFAELQARIRALLRGRDGGVSQGVLSCGDLILDPVQHRVSMNGQAIDLTAKEYRLLKYFMMHQGVALSRLQLLREVWDKNFDTNTNIVDVYVNYLRAKLDKCFQQKLIHTIVGFGYMMKP